MNRNLAIKIHQITLLSEVSNEGETEKCIPIYLIRENFEKHCIKENDYKEYLNKFAPRDCVDYIDLLIQKIYHPTVEDLSVDKELRLSLSSN